MLYFQSVPCPDCRASVNISAECCNDGDRRRQRRHVLKCPSCRGRFAVHLPTNVDIETLKVVGFEEPPRPQGQ